MSSSDDEAPEEIALSTGRSQAATLRSQEEAQRKQQSAPKRKRKRNDNGNVSDSLQQSEAPVATGMSEDEDVPDEVIEALTAADKVGAKAQAPDTADTQQHTAAQPKFHKRRQTSQRRAGPVTVQVLDGSHWTGPPSESALMFAKKQFLGSKRRSIEMLRPCQNWSGKHSNTAHHSGPAIRFVQNTASA